MRIKKLLFTAIAAFGVACGLAYMLSERLKPAELPPPPEPLPNGFVVLCLHGNERSEKCKNIETFAHEVLEESFPDTLKEDKLIWRVLNYEAPENAYLKNELQVDSPCIMLVDVRPDQPGVAKSLQKKGWELADNKPAFKEFIRAEIEKTFKLSPTPPAVSQSNEEPAP